VGVYLIEFNLQALTTRDNKGETPIDIAHRSGACAEIISLLSLTPEEARSLSLEGMQRLYAPVAYWRVEMVLWIKSQSYADCHKWINEHDDELVREVLKLYNSQLFRNVVCNSQIYSDSLVFLALRMIHRHPRSLLETETHYSPLQLAEQPHINACPEIRNVFHLTPTDIASTPFPTLLLQHLPKKYHEIYGPYNTVCEFLRRTVSPHDKAEPVEIHTNVIFFSTPENFAMNLLYDLNHRMHLGYSIAGQIISYLFET